MSDPLSDPFEALLRPATAADPDPAFAARLRARLERELLRPRERTQRTHDRRGTIMPSTSTSTSTSTATPTALRQGDVGFVSLRVPDAGRAAAFYQAVLGWRYEPGGDPRGRLVEGLTLPHGIWSQEGARTLWACHLVDDVRAAAERVRAAGGRAEEPVQEPYGLVSACVDDQGLEFSLYELPGASAETGSTAQGEVVYLTIEVRDVDRARAFYGSVLGWKFAPGNVEHGWRVRAGDAEVRPMTGLWGGRDRAAVVPMYAVDDIDAAVARVRAAGGTSTDPERQPYGITAECADDQGVRFYLGRIPG
ncbi:hypothetical protein Skr01_28510 [Sphaerisporangium krabiense]|uniref:Putative enzyme related to lactoylglutathione lyase n=1 Tax=Sphaerisporangium krabiense TaxID=763782 RepID=A0A7W8ZA38_9ACTN|nr:VOC family protein [Sphaerisporangium krabiense]MBB5630282.1 putative enzyme related to lactoylglutathione lyase [Sphaerisporangium krabiense]GII62766.1 hypothetical protein Skr01_28510 [Sphaerisporangium krabiense]